MAVYVNGVKVSDGDQYAAGNQVGGRVIRNGEEVRQDADPGPAPQ
ncbi:MAG TPA: hypothetical protein VE465_01930 [Streptosporangiaceae bacterium]|jgi:hypothetical protein|nr:hypothetical protein [Streptosporangiaceae bacterium]